MGKGGMRCFLAVTKKLLKLSCHFPGTLPMNKGRENREDDSRGNICCCGWSATQIPRMRAGHICAAVRLPSPECTYECVPAGVCLFVKVTMPALCKLFVPLVVYHSVYVCIYSTCIHGHKSVFMCVCVIECVSREKQIHLSFSDKDARNKEEGEILLQERLGKEREPNRCPYNS